VYKQSEGNYVIHEMCDTGIMPSVQIKDHSEEVWTTKSCLQHWCLERNGDVLGK